MKSAITLDIIAHVDTVRFHGNLPLIDARLETAYARTRPLARG
ncbi:hypothetical protein LMG24076_04630 [Trinickia soli]|nr:hypothetical protein LMG24076_04630 [Trinickia soli]